MTPSQNPTRFLVLSSIAAVLALSACATEPTRKAPSSDRDGPRKQARSSGTFMHPIAALFIEMDINKDKATDRSELTSGTQNQWAEFGQNPGAIRFSQWSKTSLGSTDAIPNFMNFDGDFNGTVTESEFSTQLETEFTRLDKNGDGRLERSEMLVSFQAQRSQGKGKSGQGRQQRDGNGGGRAGGGQRQR